jgi:putative FmdB family regulatory protein
MVAVPTYEYVCTKCKNHVDAVQSFTDPPLRICENCGGELRRVFHPATIQFKGSGFYSTDNRRPGGSAKPKPGEKTGDGSHQEKSTSKSSEDSSGATSSSGTASGTTKTAEKSA